MSLQVWLPLNGNLENNGVSNTDVGIMGAVPFSDGGKIGKAAQFTGNAANCIHFAGFKYIENFSWCCWFKTTNDTVSGYQYILSEGRDYDKYGLGLRLNGSNLQISYGGNKVQTIIPITINTWYHVSVTIDFKTKIKIYINGNITLEIDYVDLDYAYSNDRFVIGKMSYLYTNTTAYFPFYGYINDVRIYNHCLSPKEVKEISKGLVLHYTLDNSGCGKNNLIKNSISAPNSFYDYTGKATASRIPSDGEVATNIYAINFPVDSATYSNYNLYCSFTRDESAVQKDGKTYTLSFKIKASKPLNNYSILYEYTNTSISTNITTSWQTIKLTGVATGTYSALYLCRGIDNRNQINGGSLYIADLKLEEGSVGTNWCPHKDDPLYSILGYDSNIELDCSGLGNDGIKTSNITISTNTPRHTTSLDFTTTDYINCGRGAMVKDALTTNIWCYMDTWEADTHPWSCTESGGWNWESGDGKIRFPIYITGVGYKYTNSTKRWTDLSSGWHMFSATYDGMVIKTYIDGELDTTTQAATTKTTIGYNSTNSLFIHAEATGSATTPNTGYKACKMSDARIYATALSAEDVKELYDTAAMIDNGNNAYTYDFIE